MNIYSAILGDGMSSRLFQEIREKRGLVYSIYSFNSSCSDAGIFGIYAGCDPEKTTELIPAALNELKQATHTLTVEELQKAKNQLKARLMMSMESTSGRCQRLANQVLMFDRHIPQSETIDNINAVTAEDIVDLSSNILRSSALLVAIGKDLELPATADVEAMLN
jgi:predicted Zn-dependent peptidase